MNDTENEGIQTLPEYGEETPAYPGDTTDKESSVPDTSESDTKAIPESPEAKNSECDIQEDESNTSPEKKNQNIVSGSNPEAGEKATVPIEGPSNVPEPVQSQTAETDEAQAAHDESKSCDCSEDLMEFSSGSVEGSYTERDELDIPAGGSDAEPDELDTPAQDAAFMIAARAALSTASQPAELPIEPDELDTPAQTAIEDNLTAGDQLALDDPNAAWPESIEPLRTLFFSSETVVPFDTEGYVYIRAPLPEESGFASCLIGLLCENGVPGKVCYAIPASYPPEPPTGLEGYVWRGDHSRGYWMICEEVDT